VRPLRVPIARSAMLRTVRSDPSTSAESSASTLIPHGTDSCPLPMASRYPHRLTMVEFW